MESPEETNKRLIRSMGLKVTSQRISILDALHTGRTHITAQEIFEKVHQRYFDIGFATVYRFLKKLHENKIVTEVRMGGLPARYELTPQMHHDHLTCTQCSRIVEFQNEEIEILQNYVAKIHKFQLTDHILELYGLCDQCQGHLPHSLV